MRMRLSTLICALLLALPAWATDEEVVLGLSSDHVSITTSFDGSEILIFGAVKREQPIPTSEPLQVIITVAGPSESLVVRRKAKWKNFIWVNTDTVKIDQAPAFYAVATTAPLSSVLTRTEDLREKVTLEHAIRSVGAASDAADAPSFTDAIIRIRRKAGLYQTLEGEVSLDQQTLFRTAITMPANLTEGDYVARIFLTRNGKIISTQQTTIDVRKVGLERWLFTLSRQQSILYGLMSLAIAIAAGWGASAAFQMLRRH